MPLCLALFAISSEKQLPKKRTFSPKAIWVEDLGIGKERKKLFTSVH
jgi:hypothetical protein